MGLRCALYLMCCTYMQSDILSCRMKLKVGNRKDLCLTDKNVMMFVTDKGERYH
jgi:hypothetical protein